MRSRDLQGLQRQPSKGCGAPAGMDAESGAFRNRLPSPTLLRRGPYQYSTAQWIDSDRRQSPRFAARPPRQSSALVPVPFAHRASAGQRVHVNDNGSILVHFGHLWNFEEHLQTPKRIGRTRSKQVGHDRPEFVHNISNRETIYEEVTERVASRCEVQCILMAAMKRRRLG